MSDMWIQKKTLKQYSNEQFLCQIHDLSAKGRPMSFQPRQVAHFGIFKVCHLCSSQMTGFSDYQHFPPQRPDRTGLCIFWLAHNNNNNKKKKKKHAGMVHTFPDARLVFTRTLMFTSSIYLTEHCYKVTMGKCTWNISLIHLTRTNWLRSQTLNMYTHCL